MGTPLASLTNLTKLNFCLNNIGGITPLKGLTKLHSLDLGNTSLGRKRCDFEFEKATRAVSRRHASMERSDYVFEDP